MADTAALPIGCRSCGNYMLYVGKLPAVGRYAVVQIFKCQPCKVVQSLSVEASRADDLWRPLARDRHN